MEEDIKEIRHFFARNYFVNSDWASIHRNSIANLEESIENLLDYIEELKQIKTKIRKVKKHCDTWIKHTGNDKERDIYIKIYNMLDEIVRN